MTFLVIADDLFVGIFLVIATWFVFIRSDIISKIFFTIADDLINLKYTISITIRTKNLKKFQHNYFSLKFVGS